MAKIENKHTWGVKTAARLRAVHASFPELSPEERSDYLVDEIEYALDDASVLTGETRHSLLAVLDDYFPVYSDAQSLPSTPPPAAPLAVMDVAVGSLVDDLYARADELSPAQRQRLAGLVADWAPANAGPAVPKPLTEKLTFPSAPAEIDDFLKSVSQLWLELGVPDGGDTPLRLNRVVKMLGILSGCFRDIHRVIWPYWSTIAPREFKTQYAAAYPNGLEPAILSFITGGEVGGGAFHTEVKRTQHLLISILEGLCKGATDYGERFEQKFSPDQIAEAVALGENVDVTKVSQLVRKCWDKYTELTKQKTADAIYDDILGAVATAAIIRLKRTL